MAPLCYKEVSLSKLINEDIEMYMNYFSNSTNRAPILLFPMGLGKIVTKCVRYHAAIHNLAAFYVTTPENSTMIVVCNFNNLKKHYQVIYEKSSVQTPEDTEVINVKEIFKYTKRSIISMSSKWKRRSLGLNNNIEQNSSLTSFLLRCGENINYPGVFNFHPYTSKSCKIDRQKSTIFSDVSDQYFGYCPVYDPYPLLEEQVPDTRPIIYKFSEAIDPKSMGDTLASNPRDDSPSSFVRKLDIIPLETIPSFVLMNKTGDYDGLFFEYKYLMDQILECISTFPVVIKTINDYEPYKYFSENDLPSVIELYNIPKAYNTVNILKAYNFGSSCVKWCDNSHALLIYAEPEYASEALAFQHDIIRSRPLSNSSPICTIIACMLDFPKIFNYLRKIPNKVY